MLTAYARKTIGTMRFGQDKNFLRTQWTNYKLRAFSYVDALTTQ